MIFGMTMIFYTISILCSLFTSTTTPVDVHLVNFVISFKNPVRLERFVEKNEFMCKGKEYMVLKCNV